MISVVQLGQLDYGEGLRLQRKVVDLRKAGQIGDALLLLEHSSVITLGRNARAAHVLASAEELAARGIEVFECDRGGNHSHYSIDINFPPRGSVPTGALRPRPGDLASAAPPLASLST